MGDDSAAGELTRALIEGPASVPSQALTIRWPNLPAWLTDTTPPTKALPTTCCWHRKAWSVLDGRRSVLMNPAHEWFHTLDVWKWHPRESL